MLVLIGLGIDLVVLPLVGLVVRAKAELIGDTHTKVTSDVGAWVAAGGALHLIRQQGRRHRLETERMRLTQEMHRLLHYAHAQAAAELEQ